MEPIDGNYAEVCSLNLFYALSCYVIFALYVLTFKMSDLRNVLIWSKQG